MTGLTNITNTSLQQAICPIYREALALPPEIFGRLLAFSEVGSEYAFNNYISNYVFEKFSDLNSFITEKTYGVISLPTTTTLLIQHRNAIGAAIIGAPVALGAAISGAAVAMTQLYRQRHELQFSHLVAGPMLAASLAASMVGKLNNAAYRMTQAAASVIPTIPIKAPRVVKSAPINALSSLGNSVLKVANAGISLLKLATTTRTGQTILSYTGLSAFYTNYCSDYEKTQPQSAASSIHFFERSSEAYTSKRRKFPVIRKKDKRIEEQKKLDHKNRVESQKNLDEVNKLYYQAVIELDEGKIENAKKTYAKYLEKAEIIIPTISYDYGKSKYTHDRHKADIEEQFAKAEKKK